ncbi:MAG: DNA translocase FtsK [Ruminiclostridium sp.]|nr:DNA translocase FtsK [Ruminiclostridium sp.]
MLKKNAERRHITSIILFAVGILVLAFTLFGTTEGENLSAWDGIHTFILGTFGLSAFLVGPVLIYIAIMISADRTKATISKRMIQLLLMILLISAAAQVIFVGPVTNPELEESTLSDTIVYAYNNGINYTGGGVIGLVLGSLLMLFGQAGAIIILILIAFVIFMIMSNMSLVDLFSKLSKPIKKAGAVAKEKHELYREEKEVAEEERRRREEEARQNRHSEKERKMVEEQISEEEKRARKFAAIANVTTNARIESGEKIEKDSLEKPEEPDPMEIQRKESREFQKDLNDYLKGKIDKKEEPVHVQETVDTVKIEQPAPSDGPYSPDGPFFADDTDVVRRPFNEAVKRDSLVGSAKNTAEQSQTAESDEGDKIVSAIEEYRKEQNELNKAAEENEKVIATVIKTDSDGQERFSEIVSNAEQYHVPPSELLNDVIHERSDEDINAEIQANAETLVNTLKSFGVETKFLEAARGPSVTRYELQPAMGVKISKITGLVDDIALNLATAGVRIEAPIPNKAAVGIEVPNKKVDSVPFREMIESKDFSETTSKLGAVLGKSISGDVVIADIAKMPHILIAGTTGSGKSVCVNSIIMSILFRSTPDEVRLLMIDPKAVEFMIYNGIPHLLIPVVTDPKKAAGALAWAVTEMLNRYKLFSDNNVRDLAGYNSLAKKTEGMEPMPQIVIFIDELADLMMASPGETEDSICRLAQMARAAGMHLVIATQRPSVNVVTGVIKANIPSRIALKVASQVDSRTIIDSAGAEKLLGKGDMLYFPVGMPKPLRVQGCWVSDKEVERVVDFIKNSFVLDYDQSVIDEIEKQAELAAQKDSKGKESDDDGGDINVNDEKLDEAIEAVIEAGQASTSYLQRKLKLGYGRAARLIDTMESLGVVGGYEGSKPRQVLMTKQEWYERKMNKED